MAQSLTIPKLSIIIPSFNQGAFLRQAIESVLEQQYPNLELLVFDGKSEDDSVSIIQEYESSIDYWISEADDGQSDAINKGFQKAGGDLVAWLNADDYYLPGAFKHLVEAYQVNSQASFYFGNGYRVDKAGAIISKFFPTEDIVFSRQALVMGLNYILQPSTFINRSQLEQTGYLDSKLHYGMDSDLWMRLSILNEPMPINQTLAATREYETTKTATGSFERVEELRQIAFRYSGIPITPGVICYFLDTLHRFSKSNKDIFPDHYLNDIISFWGKTSALFSQFNARQDGFPTIPASEDADIKKSDHSGEPGDEIDTPRVEVIDDSGS